MFLAHAFVIAFFQLLTIHFSIMKLSVEANEMYERHLEWRIDATKQAVSQDPGDTCAFFMFIILLKSSIS